jgi:hypothetical protein
MLAFGLQSIHLQIVLLFVVAINFKSINRHRAVDIHRKDGDLALLFEFAQVK